MIQGFDPRTGEPVGEPVPETTDAGLDATVAAAVAAFPAWSAFPRRAEALEAVADALDARAGEIAAIADTETALGGERLTGEVARTTGQLRLFAAVLREAADDVFAVRGTNPLLNIALELEKVALEDDYFVSRRLYPNVDFYSGLIYQALGLPPAMFPVLFALARTAGWLAQWREMLNDPEQKIVRPLQLYTGSRTNHLT